MFLLVGAISSLLTEGASVVGIALCLLRNIFFAILYFDSTGTTYLKYMKLLYDVGSTAVVNNADVAASC